MTVPELTSSLGVNRKQQVSLLQFCYLLFNINEEKTYLPFAFSSNLTNYVDLIYNLFFSIIMRMHITTNKYTVNK